MSTTAVILAADAFPDGKTPKYLSLVGGVPLIERTIANARSWPVDETIVVLGSDAERVLDSVAFDGCTVVIDSEWQEGSASPLRAALDLVSRSRPTDYCLIARGDQPDVTAGIVEGLLDVATTDRVDAVIPKYRYARGFPIVLGSSVWVTLLGIEGSLDLEGIVASHVSDAAEVWFGHLEPTRYENLHDCPPTS